MHSLSGTYSLAVAERINQSNNQPEIAIHKEFKVDEDGNTLRDLLMTTAPENLTGNQRVRGYTMTLAAIHMLQSLGWSIRLPEYEAVENPEEETPADTTTVDPRVAMLGKKVRHQDGPALFSIIGIDFTNPHDIYISQLCDCHLGAVKAFDTTLLKDPELVMF